MCARALAFATRLLEIPELSSMLDDWASANGGRAAVLPVTLRCCLVRQRRHGALDRDRYEPCTSRTRTESNTDTTMSKLLRGVAAGYGAKKLGGGCFSTVLIFIILWWLLGHFGVFK